MGKESYICKLQKALCGIPSAGKLWNHGLMTFLKDYSFKQSYGSTDKMTTLSTLSLTLGSMMTHFSLLLQLSSMQLLHFDLMNILDSRVIFGMPTTTKSSELNDNFLCYKYSNSSPHHKRALMESISQKSH
jgi:hypothetical protein